MDLYRKPLLCRDVVYARQIEGERDPERLTVHGRSDRATGQHCCLCERTCSSVMGWGVVISQPMTGKLCVNSVTRRARQTSPSEYHSKHDTLKQYWFNVGSNIKPTLFQCVEFAGIMTFTVRENPSTATSLSVSEYLLYNQSINQYTVTSIFSSYNYMLRHLKIILLMCHVQLKILPSFHLKYEYYVQIRLPGTVSGITTKVRTK